MSTNIKFTKAEEEKLKTWQNATGITPDQITEKHADIYKYIKKKYTKPNTIKTHLILLTSILKKFKDDDKI